MKNTLILLCAILIFACKKEVTKKEEAPKDYVTFSGKITNKSSDSIVIRTRTYSKTISVNEDGTFSDTLKVKTGVYSFFDGNESTNVFLKNGFDINMTIDTKLFDETVKYSGIGAKTSNYLAQKSLMEESLYPPSLLEFDEADFNSETSKIYSELSVFLEKNKDIDSTIYSNEKKDLDSFKDKISETYIKGKERAEARSAQFVDFIGKPSPNFVNYENYKGGNTSLTDLKGKYVYIDVWATWCGPCLREVPSLKKVEKEYHEKNIEFVSISVDNGRGYKDKSLEAAKDGWRKMIADKELGGIQLFSDNAWKSDFITEYKIQGIPRFILIDPNGNTINADAPRPSSPKLRKLFNSLGI